MSLSSYQLILYCNTFTTKAQSVLAKKNENGTSDVSLGLFENEDTNLLIARRIYIFIFLWVHHVFVLSDSNWE